MNIKTTVIFCFFISLAACSPKADNRGYVANAQWQDVVKIGQTTRQEVLDNFGSPSAQSTFGDESWYYVSSRKETLAFLKPKIVEQHITRLGFDASGVVSAMENYSEDQAKNIMLVKRETPTEGHSLGFLEQILGNVGKFNKPSNDTAAPGRKPGRGI